MTRLQNWSLRRRLLLVFGLLLLPQIVAYAVGAARLSNILEHIEDVKREFVVEIGQTGALEQEILELVVNTDRFIRTRAPTAAASLEASLGRFHAVSERMRTTVYTTGTEQRLVTQILADAGRMESRVGAILHVRDAATGRDTIEPLLSLAEVLQENVALLGEINHTETIKSIHGATRAARTLRYFGLASAIVGLGGGIVLAIRFAGHISRGVLRVARGSHRLATGDLGHRIGEDAGGELGDVARAFNAMAERLQVSHVTLAAKNKELEDFVHVVSHDLKSPLVTIEGFVGMVQADQADRLDATGQRHLQRIGANVEQMERLIDDLLVLSRVGREARPPERIAVNEVVDERLNEMADRIRARGVKVECGDLGTVMAVRTQMVQIWSNLLTNAVKYLGDTPTPTIKIGRTDHGGVAEFRVRDNGIGIDPAYHAQVFEVFQRLKEVEAEGSGVGLAIVQKIVESVGGRLWVESAKGHGATFFFTWPAS